MMGFFTVHYNESARRTAGRLYVGATLCGLAARMYWQTAAKSRVTCKRCLRMLGRRT